MGLELHQPLALPRRWARGWRWDDTSRAVAACLGRCHFEYRTEDLALEFTDQDGLAGETYDPDTGLYDYRARWYAADVGRFVSEDPIGFAAGDANIYRYCRNSPVINGGAGGQLLTLDNRSRWCRGGDAARCASSVKG